ncbi:prephenate dehydrogenase/arogenate dehydrogenase family protein [Limnochorda pilosa]|uniref:prephenate dehydrogenase/arogenate dehydrogenase family protein n=1 Tax=Limnochorda pilosa TaxID=1555112 RepID=UPI0011873F5F|nr:prephenate dehydrogenase/arogenate dehydrogenase family protein [Limnochorda pilosa]
MRVGVVGVGLMGGSLGMALRRFGGAAEVVGVVRTPDEAARAVEAGAIDRGSPSPEILAGCEVVVLATPVEAILPVLERCLPFIPPSAAVTDVGSVKTEICRGAWARLGRQGPAFVGGHPMTGSERTGVDQADPYLFQHAVYVLCPPPAGTPGGPEATARVRSLVASVGAEPVVLEPEEHDGLVAAVSHLPHVAAAALVLSLEGTSSPWVDRLAAGGFRDTTRIASGDPALWRQILLANREAILQQAGAFRSALDRLVQALAHADGEELGRLLEEAVQRRRQVTRNARGLLAPHPELIVRVPDEVGAIHQVTGVLAGAGVNLADIEILRVREGEGGSVRIALESESERDRAREVLERAGYWARVR